MLIFTPADVVELVMRGYQVGTEPPTLGEVHEAVSGFLAGPMADLRPHLHEIVDEVLKRLSVRIGIATVLEDSSNHEAWLDADAKAGWTLWPRYRGYLRDVEKLSPAELSELDRSSDLALARLERPLRTGRWDRRGLVVGHVQSGKTTNYTALLSKAIDSGYRIAIVLAGLHNSLRSQTHERIDRDLLGRNTKPLDAVAEATKKYGVAAYACERGLPEPQFSLLTCTTAREDGDFKSVIAGQVWIQVSEGARLVMVVKKNATILKKLHQWLKQLLGEGKGDLIHQPTLFIDDEADQASINTRDKIVGSDGEEVDPSVINGWVRKLLMLFPRVGYVAYTATPFANIFIDPSRNFDRKEYGPDLFPRSFIVNLKASDNYVGADLVFGHPGDESAGIDARPPLPMNINVFDGDAWIPSKHGKDFYPGPLPKSLREALKLFLLNCSIRAIRGQSAAHNSMLVHATRFVLVQNRIKDLIDEELIQIRSLLENGSTETTKGLKKEFFEVWESILVSNHTSFANKLGSRCLNLPDWADVWIQLQQTVRRVQAMKINGTSEDVLAYSEHPEGMWVVAIGGDRLSRGLTLSGLSVSYFLRTSRMFDTLMQMGRWFGYRPGYVDVCRVYTTPELFRAFRQISLALEDLRNDFDRMALSNQTPEQFGLRVRTPSDGLLITAANKLKRFEKVDVRFAGTLVQSLAVPRSGERAVANRSALEALLNECGPSPSREARGKDKAWFVWHGLKTSVIRRFLASFTAYSTSSFLDGCKPLVRYIDERQEHGQLKEWTVCVISLKVGEPAIIGGLTIRPVFRDSTSDAPPSWFETAALVGSEEEAVDLTIAEYSNALTRTNDLLRAAGKAEKSMPDREVVREVRPAIRGLLLVYPLQNASDGLVVASAISFPSSDAPALSYVVNEVWSEQFGLEPEPDDAA